MSDCTTLEYVDVPCDLLYSQIKHNYYKHSPKSTENNLRKVGTAKDDPLPKKKTLLRNSMKI